MQIRIRINLGARSGSKFRSNFRSFRGSNWSHEGPWMLTILSHDEIQTDARAYISSVAGPGCLSRIRIRLFSILDPGSEFFHIRIPDTPQRIKELKYLNPKKWFLSSRKYDSDCSSRIPDPYFYLSRIQGSKGHRNPDPDPLHCL